jgi:hypothetical protein
MKLRIHQNSLRIRLSEDEVGKLLAARRLENRICFGTDGVLAYTIGLSLNVDTARVSFDGKELRVDLAELLVKAWGDGGEVGIHENLETPEGPLELLIEKDRQP